MQIATTNPFHPAEPSLTRIDTTKQRFLSIDLCKGFTVLFMPAVHSMVLYSRPDVYTSIPAVFLGFIAQWQGAPIFMFLMGIGVAYSKKSTFNHLRKAFLIFLAAFVLNTLKFVLPLWLGLIPSSFVDAVTFEHPRPSWINFLLLGDIFQFAALALVVMTLLKKLKRYILPPLFLTILVLIFSPLFWDLHAQNPVLDYLYTLLGGQPPDVFFPVFPWLIYPLTGLAVGEWMKHSSWSLKLLALAGIAAVSLSVGMRYKDFQFLTDSFYRTDAMISLQHLGFILLWFSIWVACTHLFFQRIQNHPFLLLLRFCGRHITIIYLLQWILIFWALPLIGYQKLSLYQTLLVSSVITGVVLCITYLLTRHTIRQTSHSNNPALNTK
jgi:uncharacterized membrane protein